MGKLGVKAHLYGCFNKKTMSYCVYYLV